jgi:hypothetical protein
MSIRKPFDDHRSQESLRKEFLSYVGKNNIEQAKKMLRSSGIKLDEDDGSLLKRCCSGNKIEFVKALVNYGASTSYYTVQSAIHSKNWNIFIFIFQRWEKSKEGERWLNDRLSPIMHSFFDLSVEVESIEILKYLVEKYKDIGIANKKNQQFYNVYKFRALILTAEKGNVAIAKYLLGTFKRDYSYIGPSLSDLISANLIYNKKGNHEILIHVYQKGIPFGTFDEKRELGFVNERRWMLFKNLIFFKKTLLFAILLRNVNNNNKRQCIKLQFFKILCPFATLFQLNNIPTRYKNLNEFEEEMNKWCNMLENIQVLDFIRINFTK